MNAPARRAAAASAATPGWALRLCWRTGLARDDEQLTVEGVPAHFGAGRWLADTPAIRRALAQAMAAGNDTFGPGTHWIETRQT
jgi:hypothetical protein